VIQSGGTREEGLKMARYVASVDTAWERDAAFDYLAAFANIADWDPSVKGAESLTSDPLARGARFRVDFSMLGRELPLVYETIAIERPLRVTLRAETPTAVSLDTMTFDLRPEGGTIVTYDADVQLRGALRLLDLPFRLPFRRLGDRARDGLRKRLAQPQPAAMRTPA
jgi:hypothetical protein